MWKRWGKFRPKTQVADFDDCSTESTEEIALLVNFQRTNWYFFTAILGCKTVQAWLTAFMHDFHSFFLSELFYVFYQHGLHVRGSLLANLFFAWHQFHFLSSFWPRIHHGQWILQRIRWRHYCLCFTADQRSPDAKVSMPVVQYLLEFAGPGAAGTCHRIGIMLISIIST